ncbi:hypothetical protein ABVT39_012608 [Epinephelus coioides]
MTRKHTNTMNGPDECEEGYQRQFTLTCGERGWHGNAQCTEITCDRREYRNTEIVGSYKYEYRYNDQVQYICKNGHEGSFHLTCKETGWIGSPDCTKRYCEKLHIDHADITHNEKETYSHNERVHYACTHERGKIFTVTCEQSVWTGVQKCAANANLCSPPPKVPNAFVVTPYQEEYLSDSTVTYLCRDSYTLVDGEDTIRCIDGKWETKDIKCTLRHGFAVGPYDGTVYYTCDEGYKLFTKGWWAEAKCNDGEWSGFELCIENEKCGKIPVIPNADVTPPRREDQSYRITCQEGYIAQVERFTCRQGKWDFGGFSLRTICTPNANLCSPPPKVANAFVLTPYQEEYLSDSTVTYLCRDSYTLVDGEDTIRCIDGKWETKDIKCTPCPTPEVRHGFAVGPYNGTVYYTCDEGYKLFTKGWWAEAKCNDGEWSGFELCIENEKCGKIPVIPNADVTPPRREDQSYRITCQEGYIAQVERFTCRQGKWDFGGFSLRTICTPNANLCSPPPKVANAFVLTPYQEEYLSDSTVTYLCRDSYTLVDGEDTIRCIDGKWETKDIKCTHITCEAGVMPPHLNVTGLPPANETMKIGHKLQFSCDDQYTMEGSAESECLQTGQWSAAFPTCTAITCTVPNIENGYVPGNIQGYKEHEVLHYECNAGYKRAEERPSKCIKLGIRAEWSPTPACESIKCKLTLPPVEGTRYEPTHRTLFLRGDTLRVICGEKYWISTPQDASAVTTCKDDGEWTIRPICQEVRCSNQRPRHVYSWQVYWGQRIGLGDTVIYWCRSGYRRTGGATWATCTRDGWNPDPLCQATVNCASPPPLADGDVKYTLKSEYSHDERVEYVCQSYYTMEGEPYRTCINGEWIGQMRCLKPCTVNDDDMRQHNIALKYADHHKIYSAHNDHIEFRCTKGRPVGTMRQKCDDGVILLPSCEGRRTLFQPI